MNILLQITAWTIVAEGALVGFLTLAPRLGPQRRLAAALARAPMLDVVVALLVWAPWVVGAVIGGWWGFVATLAAQSLALAGWVTLHEAMHPNARKGPRIVKALNRTVGRAPNHLALWVSLLALPGFWVVRLSQVLIYPPLRWLLGFPAYRHGEWVNVSRHKFDGLVGHDLVWCLYCDWMTGVYALGGEMLRNVESFWCPIRFSDAKKCENCRIDFPDLDGGWVRADGAMGEVESVLQEKYGNGRREWFGHPVRLTTSAQPKPSPDTPSQTPPLKHVESSDG